MAWLPDDDNDQGVLYLAGSETVLPDLAQLVPGTRYRYVCRVPKALATKKVELFIIARRDYETMHTNSADDSELFRSRNLAGGEKARVGNNGKVTVTFEFSPDASLKLGDDNVRVGVIRKNATFSKGGYGGLVCTT
ncbi:MAG: hypothetical protein JKY37_33060 [Nannocystaceae bacterium]|nr:hypothetical protein [Nannocystaceae bacterium]